MAVTRDGQALLAIWLPKGRAPLPPRLAGADVDEEGKKTLPLQFRTDEKRGLGDRPFSILQTTRLKRDSFTLHFLFPPLLLSPPVAKQALN